MVVQELRDEFDIDVRVLAIMSSKRMLLSGTISLCFVVPFTALFGIARFFPCLAHVTVIFSCLAYVTVM